LAHFPDVSTASIIGLPVSAFDSLVEASERIISSDGAVQSGWWVAMNAEKVVAAKRSPETFQILDSATVRYADGVSIVMAMQRKGVFGRRIPGCDLWEELMRRAAALSIPVFLVGGKPEVLRATCEKLEKEVGVPLVGSQDGYFSDDSWVIDEIARSGAKIVTVGLGSPKQERFIDRCRKHHPDAFYLGVGGTYDVFTGAVDRAPKYFQRMNLEWFYRLLRQPTRIGRQLRLVEYLILMYANKI